MKNNALKNKTISGLIWSFTELMSNQGIQIIVQIVLARLLVPEHFGLIGMLTIFIAISNSLVQSGMDQALIRESNPTQIDYSTVFYFNLVVSALIYISLYISAPLISSFFNAPQLTEIIRILMLVVIFNALIAIQRVFLIRKLDFKTQARITVIAGIISGILAILAALFGFGVWSLVIQTLCMQLVQSILFFVSNRWLPSLTFSIPVFKRFFNFGYKLLLSQLIDTVYKNIYFVIIGRLYPAAILGYYTNASRLRDVSSQSLTQAIQKVTYPMLSSIKEEQDKLANSYKKVIKMSGYIIFPFMLGLAATAPNFIPFLLGEQWIPSVIYFQLLCIAGMLYPIHAINLNILKVKGRSDLFLKLEIIKKSFLSVLIILAVVFDTGVIGLISAAITNSYISLLINMYYSGREISYSYSRQLMDLLPAFLSAVIMGVTVYLANYMTSGIYAIDLILQIILGIGLYILLSWLFRIKEFKDILNVFKYRLKLNKRTKLVK